MFNCLRRRWYSRAALLISLIAAQAYAAQTGQPFHLKDGDKVVFYGDSITDYRFYTTFTETFVATRFPGINVDFIHSGWGGDSVRGGAGGDIATRLSRDVFAHKPSVVTVMLGMNDGSYQAFNDAIFSTYISGLKAISEELLAKIPDLRLTLIRTSPFDDVTRQPTFPGGYNLVLTRYGDAVTELASSLGQNSANFNAPLVAAMEKAKLIDAALAEQIIPDRVHPAPAAHLVMAAELLKTWNAPSLVSSVEFDVKRPGTLLTSNTEVKDLNLGARQVEWTQIDRALPMPMDRTDRVIRLILASSNVVEEINNQRLRVSGLDSPGYDLMIDGQYVHTFRAAELAAGINLANYPTPMNAQAAAVHALTVKRAALQYIHLREFTVPYADASPPVATHLQRLGDTMETANRAIVEMRRVTAQPVPRKFSLVSLSAEELAMFGEPLTTIPAQYGPNLALGKPWVSDAPNYTGWNVGLTDGSWDSAHPYTFATDSQASFPKTVTVDLGQSLLLNRVVTGVPGFGSTKTVEVSLGDNTGSFKKIGRYVFSMRNEEKRGFAFSPTTARYVRISYLDHHSETEIYVPQFAFTTDLQVFGPQGK